MGHLAKLAAISPKKSIPACDVLTLVGTRRVNVSSPDIAKALNHNKKKPDIFRCRAFGLHRSADARAYFLCLAWQVLQPWAVSTLKASWAPERSFLAARSMITALLF
jgi:hypothetical protein